MEGRTDVALESRAQGVLTLKEVAQRLRCSKAHLSNVIAGKVLNLPPLPVVRIGRRLLVRDESLSRWLAAVER
jgi:excisionase family DNA binding protein